MCLNIYFQIHVILATQNKKLMKKINTLIIALLVAGVASAQTWSLDKGHAKLGFGITHLMISDVEGAFTSFDAKITSSKEDFSDAVIELTADAASVNTNSEDRDKHLKNEDFFHVEKFPTLTFKSKSFTKVEGKKYKLTGDLTMHGVTKPVTLDVIFNGTAVHPYNKKTLAGFKISGTLKRSDFNFGSKYPSAVLGEEVTITANTEFIKG
jgi:polyisoprenoid-binding protein YceI